MAFHMPTVLVVEDEPLIRMLLSEALEEAGYRVLEAACVLEAAAVLGFQKIDAVVTDIDMPGGLSGIDLAWLVDDAFKSITIVVASGGQNPARYALPRNAHFFPKPYRLDDIVGVLGKVGRLPGLSTLRIAV
jgi:CheY-like chemotaxis protein